MAKIGDEARLILKLAKERMDAKCADRSIVQDGSVGEKRATRNAGFKDGVAEFNLELNTVVRELEAGR